ncbi:MAG: sensor histidine kinase [Pseudomonadales bacterium]
MAEYNSQGAPSGDLSGSGQHFALPELCTPAALSLLVLVGELLVLVLLFAGGEISWTRFALMSLFVQWVTLISAGLLCLLRPRLAMLNLVLGALGCFVLVMLVTLTAGLLADRIVAGSVTGGSVDWSLIAGQQVIAGIITTLALRYFYVQQQLRAQEQSELRARIQALQSRIRPHFLFNSMNIIASLIATDPETAESVVEDLSELFRASLNDAGNQVLLEEELALCERYMRIEALRLGERLTLRWEIEEIPQGVRIPLLTLQPLLENAIYHGVQPLPEGGEISVRLWFADGMVNVEIGNPFPDSGTTAHKAGNRMALGNIRSRLAVLYGNRAQLETLVQDQRYLTRLRYPLRAADA